MFKVCSGIYRSSVSDEKWDKDEESSNRPNPAQQITCVQPAHLVRRKKKGSEHWRRVGVGG